MTCLTCGVEIPPERVAAMPLAEFYVACQPEPKPIRPEQVPEAMAVVEIDLREMLGR